MRFQKTALHLLILLTFASCHTMQELHQWEALETDKGIFVVKYADAPAFGPHTVHFYFLEENSQDEVQLGTTELNNDGANLGDANFEVLQRKGDLLIFQLKGQQMQPEKWQLSFSGSNPVLEKME